MTTNPTPKDFIKLYLTVILFATILSLITVLFSGCASRKPIESTHTTERIIEIKTDSSKVTEVNKAIIDSLIIVIAKVKTAKPECDSITQTTLDNVLAQLNTRKKSGDNEAGIYYDKLKKMIVIYSKLAETKTENTAVNKKLTDVKAEKQIISIPVKYIPLWVKILAWIGGLTVVFVIWRIARIFI